MNKFRMMSVFVVLAMLFGFANVSPAATASTAQLVTTTLYDETFTGADLDAQVTSGNASYPAADFTNVIGTRLDISPQSVVSTAPIMFRMPILDAGALFDCEDVVVTVTIDWLQLTTDNDFGIAVSDGIHAIGGMQQDAPYSNLLDFADNGTELGYSQGREPNPSYSSPQEYVISVADVGGNSTVQITNNLGVSKTYTGVSSLGYSNSFDFLLVGNHHYEIYGVNSVSIKVEGSCNSSPIAVAAGPYLVAAGEPVTFDGSGSTDPDSDPLSYSWTAYGGTLDDYTAESPTYTAGTVPGVYDVCLTVSDGGLYSDPSCTMVVVYDPSGGFVTGGGWIDSAAEACEICGGASGKATFGFVAKYKKGANVPDGNAQFKFKAGDLDFDSTSYEWLVVAGNKAQFRGEGTINGEGSYTFMIWADDDDPDTFRIHIWGDTGTVYDNGSQQALGGGSIKVHNN